MTATINIQKLWDQKYRDESVPFPIDGLVGTTSSSFNVADYGAKSDGVTDDTAAIQAAIEAAAPVAGTVQIGSGFTMFSTLRVYANMRLRGGGMNETILKRIPGSTGTAIREKTSAEGNAAGATGLWIQDLQIDGNSTTGDGLDLGNQVPAVQLNFNAGVENVHVRNFTTGTGIRIRGNAVQCKYLWSNLNNVGIVTQGGGNAWYGLLAEGNTTKEIQVATDGDSYYHTQVETGATLPIEVTANQNTFYGIYVGLGANLTQIVQVTTGAARNQFYGVFMATNGHTFSNLIYVQTNSQGTGSTSFLVPSFLDIQSDNPLWFYDQASNQRMLMTGLGLDSDPPGFAALGANGAFKAAYAGRFIPSFLDLTYGATVTVNAALGQIFRLGVLNTSAFTISDPTNAMQGQVITFHIINESGGGMGAITWGPHYFLSGAFTNPASGKSRVITFYCDGTNWVETSRTMADG